MALPDFIRSLEKPGTQLEQTHIDYVVVGPKYAYKIKKPVRFAFVDFSTLKKRHFFCREEVRLNRRYSPSIYLGVEPLKRAGKTVEYAVKMRSFPPADRLACLLRRNKVTAKMIVEIADEIWRFHRGAKALGPCEIKKIWRAYQGDYLEIRKMIGQGLSAEQYQRLFHGLKSFLFGHRAFFQRRQVRDLHGDFQSENIFYHGRPYILDCVEFNRAFRQIDTAAEIAFFLMDLEYKGKTKLAAIFLRRYLERSRDWGLLPVLRFYQCHYASVRGMVAGLTRQPKSSRQHFRLALRYLQPKPLLFAVGGLIGSGKSTLARQLSHQLSLPILRSDRIRKELAGKPPFTPLPACFYSAQFTQRTYTAMYQQAKKRLSHGAGVILDATFATRALRRGLIKLAKQSGAELFFIEATAPTSVLFERLQRRKNDVSDAGPKLLKYFLKSYEPPEEMPAVYCSSTHSARAGQT